MTCADFPKPSEADIDAAALAIWREREHTFPKFTQRMTPDATDRQSGAWEAVRAWARAAITEYATGRAHHD